MEITYITSEGKQATATVTARATPTILVCILADGSTNIIYTDKVVDGDVHAIPVGGTPGDIPPPPPPPPSAADLSDTTVLDTIKSIFAEGTFEAVISNSKAVQDENGRYHAPHDGFEWEGRVYKGGEYLLEGEYRANNTCRVKMVLSEIILLKNEGISVSYGKVWDVDGVDVAYATFYGTKGQCNKLTEMFPRSGKELLLHDDNDSGRGKPFKFSTRTMSYIYNSLMDYDRILNAFIAKGLDSVPYNVSEKGIVSDWSGQMVSYKYHSGIFRL